MIRRESGRIVVSGPVTLANVAAVLEEARRHLEEGVRMMGNVTGCPVESVRIGLPVEAYAVECSEGLAVPFWRAR